MASITGAANEKIFSLKGWGGLNESPDGDTRLKLGEASRMINWKVTRDGNLKRRPGTEYIAGLCSEYELHYSGDISELQAVELTDTVAVYSSASELTQPGKVTLVGASGGVVNGMLLAEDVPVRDGVLEFPAESGATIQNGVLNEDPATANFCQQRYDELKATLMRGLPSESEDIEDVYGPKGGIHPYNEFSRWI